MIENYVSLLFAIVEILFFSGIGFGFPFIQYVFEDEFIFYKEKCGNEESFDTKVLCEAAKQQYNTVFTSAIVGNVCNLSKTRIVVLLSLWLDKSVKPYLWFYLDNWDDVARNNSTKMGNFRIFWPDFIFITVYFYPS